MFLNPVTLWMCPLTTFPTVAPDVRETGIRVGKRGAQPIPPSLSNGGTSREKEDFKCTATELAYTEGAAGSMSYTYEEFTR